MPKDRDLLVAEACAQVLLTAAGHCGSRTTIGRALCAQAEAIRNGAWKRAALMEGLFAQCTRLLMWDDLGWYIRHNGFIWRPCNKSFTRAYSKTTSTPGVTKVCISTIERGRMLMTSDGVRWKATGVS